jgi:hypothetical protein
MYYCTSIFYVISCTGTSTTTQGVLEKPGSIATLGICQLEYLREVAIKYVGVGDRIQEGASHSIVAL